MTLTSKFYFVRCAEGDSSGEQDPERQGGAEGDPGHPEGVRDLHHRSDLRLQGETLRPVVRRLAVKSTA